MHGSNYLILKFLSFLTTIKFSLYWGPVPGNKSQSLKYSLLSYYTFSKVLKIQLPFWPSSKANISMVIIRKTFGIYIKLVITDGIIKPQENREE